MVEEGRKRSVRVRGSGKLFHFPWEGGSGRGRDTDIGFETLKPRDRKRQIHGRLFPLVTWALLTTHYPMTKTKPPPSLFLFSRSISTSPIAINRNYARPNLT